MVTSTCKPEHSARAREIWDEYQRRHDLSGQMGKVAAIDPVSGRVWIGASGVDVADRMAAEGIETPVYLVRVGSDAYVRKGRR
jgi:hypothetical protein